MLTTDSNAPIHELNHGQSSIADYFYPKFHLEIMVLLSQRWISKNSHIPEGRQMKAEVKIFKTLGDSLRLRLAAILACEGETCVSRLAQALDEPDYKVSRHLAIMRSAEIVEIRRKGTWIYYQLTKPKAEMEHQIHHYLTGTLCDHPTIAQDRQRLAGEG